MDAETRPPVSTNHYCIQAIKSVARRANLLDPESAKSYIASANVTEAHKPKHVEDLEEARTICTLSLDDRPVRERTIYHLLQQTPN